MPKALERLNLNSLETTSKKDTVQFLRSSHYHPRYTFHPSTTEAYVFTGRAPTSNIITRHYVLSHSLFPLSLSLSPTLSNFLLHGSPIGS